MYKQVRIAKIVIVRAVLLGLLVMSSLPGLARDKYETIEATAFGTGTQMGANIGVTLNIYEYSTPADRQILIQAYEKDRPGLVNALQKMKAVGHVEITGTLGNDCSYIKMIPTPTGRKIIFVTNRRSDLGRRITTPSLNPSTSLPASSKSTIRTRARAPVFCIPRRNWSSIARDNCSGICGRTRGNWSMSSIGRERPARTSSSSGFMSGCYKN